MQLVQWDGLRTAHTSVQAARVVWLLFTMYNHIVSIGHGLLKKFGPIIMGCFLRPAESFFIWIYADPFTSFINIDAVCPRSLVLFYIVSRYTIKLGKISRTVGKILHENKPSNSHQYLFNFSRLVNLSYDERGHIVPPKSVFIFLPKISPPDQTLRPTCKFLILGLLYHDFFFLLKI